MSEGMLFLLGAAFCALMVAGWNWANHSAPTASRVQRRRKVFLRAKALYMAEAAALQAYYEGIGPVKAQQVANQFVAEASVDVRQ